MDVKDAISRQSGRRGDGDPWSVLMGRLVEEVAALKADPDFAGEMIKVAHRLAIPLPAAVVSSRTRAAVVRRCTELTAEEGLRQAAALLAGYLLAVVWWERPGTPVRAFLSALPPDAERRQ